jgi:hypothetical protein
VMHFTVNDGIAFGEGQGYQLQGVCVAPSNWSLLD